MEPFVISLLTGVLAGVIYSVVRVRSPAPPIIALVGLLGMVIGTQIIPVGQRLFASAEVAPRSGEAALTHTIRQPRAVEIRLAESR